jgi:hypothetical protein
MLWVGFTHEREDSRGRHEVSSPGPGVDSRFGRDIFAQGIAIYSASVPWEFYVYKIR